MTDLNLAHLQQWIGKTEEHRDVVTPQAVRRLRATLFRDPVDSDEAPLTMHWTLAPPAVTFGELASDGHPAKGGFLPPVPLPRRMWAGGKVEFFDRLRVMDEVTRTSRIDNVVEKKGGTGTLCFVTVNHDISTPRGLAIRERQDIVYREPVAAGASQAPAKAAAATPAQHSRAHPANEVVLLRYSAVTFNGHRIHYDRAYATEEEGYSGLVVHGPLQSALLIEFAADLRGTMPKTFDYRGVAPLFAGPDFTVNANATEAGMDFWTANASGAACMKGSATW